MTITILNGDVRAVLPTMANESVDCVVTSPPYWGLRDYGVEGQIGLETTVFEYLDEMVAVCRELRRVLKPEGTFWLNIGDSYNSREGQRKTTDRSGPKQGTNIGASTAPSRHDSSLKPKDLCMVPNRLAIRLQEDGWWVRSEIIWHKTNPMPESVKDRPTCAHEKVWLLTKNEKYLYDDVSVSEEAVSNKKKWTDKGSEKQRGHGRRHAGFNGRYADNIESEGAPQTRNLRNVWTIATKPFVGAHFATFPPELVERCIKAGCPAGGMVLDPFGGAGTTGLVADRLGRNATLIELNPAYIEIARKRISDDAPLFSDIANDNTKERAIAAA